MNIKHIAVLAILVLVLIFTLQNIQVVEIRFFFWTISAVRAVVLAFTFITGVIAGMLLPLLWRKKSDGKHEIK